MPWSRGDSLNAGRITPACYQMPRGRLSASAAGEDARPFGFAQGRLTAAGTVALLNAGGTSA